MVFGYNSSLGGKRLLEQQLGFSEVVELQVRNAERSLGSGHWQAIGAVEHGLNAENTLMEKGYGFILFQQQVENKYNKLVKPP